MAFLDDVKEKASAFAKSAGATAKEIGNFANLKAQVVSCDGTMLKGYKDLGKAYYEAHKDDEAMEFAEIMTTIKTAEEKKAALEAQLAEAKASDVIDVADLDDESHDTTYQESSVTEEQ